MVSALRWRLEKLMGVLRYFNLGNTLTGIRQFVS